MAKRKFGTYTVDVTKISSKTRSDGLIETRAKIVGDIEIGISIDIMTWREDWLAAQMFGKEKAGDYKLVNVGNNLQSSTENLVIAVWRKR